MQKNSDGNESVEIPATRATKTFVPELAESLGMESAGKARYTPAITQVTHIKGENVLPNETERSISSAGGSLL